MVLYRRLFTFIMPFWIILFLGITANVVYSGIDAGLTYMIRPLMDKSFVEQDFQFIATIPWILFFSIAARGAVSALGGYSMTWVARSVVKSFREKVFRHVLHLPVSYYDQSPSGKLLSKLLYDVEQVAQVSADALTTFVQSVCLVVGLLVVMFVINWQLSLFFMLTVPFIALIVNFTNKRTRKVSHAVQATMGNVTDIAGEVIDGYQTVRLFGGEAYETKRFNKAIEASRQKDMKVAKLKVINVVGVQLVIALGIALIVMISLHLAKQQIVVTAGGFVAILAAMLQLIKPMKNLSTVNSTIQRGLAGAESIFALFDTALEKDMGKKILQEVKGEIKFDAVSFAYVKNKPVIHDLNLTIRAGQTVALVGLSGSGKSTLSSLLPRFYEIDDGNIYIDGVSINEIKRSNLREHIALVSQNIVLFNDTVANNIAYAKDTCSREMIIEAAKQSYSYDFINALPEGFDTHIGENGVLLSGGQRQRIAIARALLKKAPILILDEATSALDNQAEKYIQKALDRVMQSCTTIVIAHRLSTIVKADKIVVLNEGRIIETGSHRELLATGKHYASLYHLQFKEQEVPVEIT